jgi:hypothetical protein
VIIYNVTTKVAWPVSEAWVQWMQDVHIPEILGTGCFTNHQFAKLLEVDEEDGPTYTVQYHATSIEQYQEDVKQYSQIFRQEVLKKWSDKIVAFRSLMEVVK